MATPPPPPPPQIPSPANVIRPAVLALLATRPSTLPHLNNTASIYSHLIAGWQAQAALAVARLADGAKNGRLGLAEGNALLRLARSEYDAISVTAPTTAHGVVSVSRPAGTNPQGVIPKGFRLNRGALDGVPLPIAAASYTVDHDVQFASGDVGPHLLQITAVRPGSGSNTPSNVLGATVPPVGAVDRLFDPSIVFGTYSSSGGSDGIDDADVRRYAKAFASGQFGPNDAALDAAALRQSGARHVALKFDTTTAVEKLYIYDHSWCSGLANDASYWQQLINDSGFVGFGCSVAAQGGQGILTNVALTVRLRDPKFLADTTGIDESIRTALLSYFDERTDFWIFKLNAIRGIVSRCDKRILRCTAAVVKDYTGSPIAEPTQASTPMHYHLANNAVTSTYLGPV